jgi:phage protein D
MWQLVYLGVNITAEISRMVEQITYFNHEAETSDELELVIEDSAQLWQGAWSPTFGDALTLQIGYAGEQLLPCGSFQIDQVELQGPPDVIHLKAIAAGPTPAIRTRTSQKYEGLTLAQIAAAVAARNAFTLVNAPASDIRLNRVTQSRETDVQFLRRLANSYNYDFSIRGSQLIFYPRAALESAAVALNIRRTDVSAFEFTAKTGHTYRAARVSYQNPATKQMITQIVTDSDIRTGDTLDIVERTETVADAQAKATAALHERNMLQAVMRLHLPGNPALVAGVNVSVNGFGQNDGNYLVTKSRHRLERSSGYTTEIEARSLS